MIDYTTLYIVTDNIHVQLKNFNGGTAQKKKNEYHDSLSII